MNVPLTAGWGFGGLGGHRSLGKRKKREKRKGKMRRKNGANERGKKERSPSTFQIIAKNKGKAPSRGGAGRGEHGEVKPHQRRGEIRLKNWLNHPLMLARAPRPARTGHGMGALRWGQ